METQCLTHEQFIHAVRDIVAGNVSDATIAERIRNAKLVYGIGDGSYRGVCYYDSWKNGHGPVEMVEISATGEESPVQLAGTTIHELGHVVAGKNAGHGPDWKLTANNLGLLNALASGHVYTADSFAPSIRDKILALGTCADGSPLFGTKGDKGYVGLPPLSFRPCPLGIGTKGGKSRGTGSGSRLRKYVLDHDCKNEDGTPQPKVIRIASDTAQVECGTCHTAFKR